MVRRKLINQTKKPRTYNFKMYEAYKIVDEQMKPIVQEFRKMMYNKGEYSKKYS